MKQYWWLALIVVLMFVFCCVAGAQTYNPNRLLSPYAKKLENNHCKTKIGVELGIHSGSNGHGAFYFLGTNIKNAKNIYYIDLMIQKRSSELSGARIGYARNIVGSFIKEHVSDSKDSIPGDNNFMLSLFLSGQYLHNTRLNYKTASIESRTQISDNSQVNWSELRLSTLELVVGFEVLIRLRSDFYLRNHIGVGGYYHLNYVKGMYREQFNSLVVLGTSIMLSQFKICR